MSDNNGSDTKKEAKKEIKRAITTPDRNAFQKLICNRRDTILKTLGEELCSNPDQIYAKLRSQHGCLYTVDQLNELLRGIEAQIKQEVEKHIASERTKIQMQVADLDEEYDRKEREMKARHKAEFDALFEERKGKRKSLKDTIINLEQEIAKTHCVDMHKKKQEYQEAIAKTRQVDMTVEAQAKNQIALFRQNRGRMDHMIRDSANRALEQLWLIEDRDEAKALIESIPTVEEVLTLVQSEDGFLNLMKRFSPNLALPAPQGMSVTLDVPMKDAKVVSEEDVTEEDEDDSEDERRSRQRDHDRGAYTRND